MKNIIILLLISCSAFGQLTPANEISPFSNSRDYMHDQFGLLNNSDEYVSAGVDLNVDSLAAQRVDLNLHEVRLDSTKDGTGKLWIDTLTVVHLDYGPPHGAMSFADSSTVVALTQNVWAKITGAAGPVFTVQDQDDITIAGDTMTIEVDGDYMLNWSLSFEGTPNDVFQIVIYKNGVIESIKMSRKTSNNDTGNMTLPAYIENLVVGDDLSLYIRNTGDNDDATLVSSSVIIWMSHPD
jgi:hypothetical protein